MNLLLAPALLALVGSNSGRESPPKVNAGDHGKNSVPTLREGLSAGVVRKLHYEIGTTYSFAFELAVESDGFGGVGALRQDERMSAKCDLTAWLYSPSEYLLELDVSEMHQHSILSELAHGKLTLYAI